MNIDGKLLSKIETLSSLKIEENERENIINQLSEIVNFVENLNELDLSSCEATFTTVTGGTPFREDIPKNNEDIIKTVIKYAPKTQNGFFIVPKIIE
ncbi:MAG: Asp-tRNA(Asn)/Glu-tRNA(Gln) amidotransferase subunit GatC [Campylobacteraceae bacterium]|jgi:aspartyl-tRNA(Asn)/glutamyl-tRNA(Gln) amidotransferase subunit C|nr:Asp-tRNA(Asn)/Glu-tRNA(Gln) amidotransferase subunit GatC [Campylobacteraceae bacterium]